MRGTRRGGPPGQLGRARAGSRGEGRVGSRPQPVALGTGLFQCGAPGRGAALPACGWGRDWEAGQRPPQVAEGQLVPGRQRQASGGSPLTSNSTRAGGPLLSRSSLFRFEAVAATSLRCRSRSSQELRGFSHLLSRHTRRRGEEPLQRGFRAGSPAARAAAARRLQRAGCRTPAGRPSSSAGSSSGDSPGAAEGADAGT